jgi:hypothetical protein
MDSVSDFFGAGDADGNVSLRDRTHAWMTCCRPSCCVGNRGRKFWCGAQWWPHLVSTNRLE